jgi:hypothetical protein
MHRLFPAWVVMNPTSDKKTGALYYRNCKGCILQLEELHIFAFGVYPNSSTWNGTLTRNA